MPSMISCSRACGSLNLVTNRTNACATGDLHALHTARRAECPPRKLGACNAYVRALVDDVVDLRQNARVR